MPVEAIAYSASGELIVARDKFFTLRTWSAETGKPVLTLKDLQAIGQGGIHLYRNTGFSANARRIAARSDVRKDMDGKGTIIRKWDLGTGHGDTFRCPEHFVQGIAVSPDGKQIATGYGNLVTTWDFETGLLLHETRLGVERNYLLCFVAYSPDGSRLVVGGNDEGLMWLLDASDLRLLRTIRKPAQSPVRAVAFLPGRLRVVSGGETTPMKDHPLLLWEVDLDEGPVEKPAGGE